jgi:hypothetical protein
MRRPALAALLLATGLALGLGPGCREASSPPAPRLEVTRQRWNVDEKAGIVRVVGEMVNLGQATVPEVEVKAVLLGTSGEARGENTTPLLRNLRPGEKRQFAVNVRSHGGVARVELRPQVPEGNR